jgi:hypothetical protein
MNDIRKGSCPLCGHNEIVEAFPISFTTTVAYLTAGHVPPQVATERPIGVLKIYICRKCGNAALFADAPANIQIGPQYSTRLISGPEPEGPYR